MRLIKPKERELQMTAAADDPSVLRRRLLTYLRRQRETVGLTQREAADALDWSLSKLIRIETGMQGISVTDLKAVLALYGVTDNAMEASLIAAARGSRRQSWWHAAYRDIVSPQFAQYLGQEGIATSVQVFHPFLVPGLLHTEDYAAALLGAFPDPERARRIVELRMERQKRIFANSSRSLTIALNEEALYRWIGGPAVMRKQLQHLLGAAEASNMMLHVVPFTAGAHPGLGGPFVLLRGDETDDDTVFLESVSGDQLIRDDPETIKQYESYFEWLNRLSLSPEQVVDLLLELIDRLERASETGPGHPIGG
jgi:transcriptional regulator with XRE-family HTH domain